MSYSDSEATLTIVGLPPISGMQPSLILINVSFLLWYVNMPTELKPVQRDMRGLLFPLKCKELFINCNWGILQSFQCHKQNSIHTVALDWQQRHISCNQNHLA